MIQRVARRAKREALTGARRAYQLARFRADCPKTYVFIMGAQRSGTGMLNQAFDADWRCRAFGEDGGLVQDRTASRRLRWRWKPLHEVADILSRQRASLIVTKPLVEIGRAEEVLRAIPGKVIWMYRDYRSVAKSGFERFKADSIHIGMKAILENRPDWYSEGISDEQREVVARYYCEDRSQFDLRALGWYVRNMFYFRYREKFPIRLVRYEDLVAQPAVVLRGVYDFIGVPYPGGHVHRHIHTCSKGRGAEVEISPEIAELCDAMLKELDALA